MADKKAAYKILSSKIEYKNPYMKVHKKHIRYANNAHGTYWVMDRPGDCAIAIPLYSPTETVLVGQERITVKRFSWEFPMGSVKGENGLVAAKQELREETGLVGKKWQKIGEFYLANGYSSQKGVVFVVEELEQYKREPERHEFLTLQRTKIKDIHKMILDGTIKDGPTITAFLYLLDYLK